MVQPTRRKSLEESGVAMSSGRSHVPSVAAEQDSAQVAGYGVGVPEHCFDRRAEGYLVDAAVWGTAPETLNRVVPGDSAVPTERNHSDPCRAISPTCARVSALSTRATRPRSRGEPVGPAERWERHCRHRAIARAQTPPRRRSAREDVHRDLDRGYVARPGALFYCGFIRPHLGGPIVR